MKKRYIIRSKSGAFPDFEYEDDGLGYLVWSLTTSVIFDKLRELEKLPSKIDLLSQLGRTYWPDEDILVKPEGKDVWFKVKYRKNSSMAYLSAPGEQISLHPNDTSSKKYTYKHD
jgi:hypothetical protein